MSTFLILNIFPNLKSISILKKKYFLKFCESTRRFKFSASILKILSKAHRHFTVFTRKGLIKLFFYLTRRKGSSNDRMQNGPHRSSQIRPESSPRAKNSKRTEFHPNERNQRNAPIVRNNSDKFRRNVESVVREIEGDLFTASEEYSLAHCVATDFRMGAGIAVQFK